MPKAKERLPRENRLAQRLSPTGVGLGIVFLEFSFSVHGLVLPWEWFLVGQGSGAGNGSGGGSMTSSDLAALGHLPQRGRLLVCRFGYSIHLFAGNGLRKIRSGLIWGYFWINVVILGWPDLIRHGFAVPPSPWGKAFGMRFRRIKTRLNRYTLHKISPI